MSLTEKAAYLRGLYDGMELNESKSKEARMLSAMIDVIQELSAHVTENEASLSALADEVDDLSELTSELEERVDDELEERDFPYDEDDCLDFTDDDEDEPDLDDEDDDDFQITYEVECPNCKRMLTVGEEDLVCGTIECDTCGKKFQIEIEYDDNGEMVEDDETLLQF